MLVLELFSWRLMSSVAFVCLSDDELTPYDMSGDQEMSIASPPRYLRDCLECTVPLTQASTFSPHCHSAGVRFDVWFLALTLSALISSEDPMRVELSLRAAENLVRRNVFAAKEVRKTQEEEAGQCLVLTQKRAILLFITKLISHTVMFAFQISVQLTKVLLHMEDKYSINGFRSLRQATMVAITVTHCVPVGSQLPLCLNISLWVDQSFFSLLFFFKISILH